MKDYQKNMTDEQKLNNENEIENENEKMIIMIIKGL